MEEAYQVSRGQLREAMRQHPTWGKRRLAQELNRSVAWVRKWWKRLRGRSGEDQVALQRQSSRRKRVPARIHPVIVQKILLIRDQPAANLQRVPGPVAIRYYLSQAASLQAQGFKPPSTSTLWQVLDQHGRIPRCRPSEPQVWEPTDPLQHWQMDFKDVVSIAPEPAGKQQHGVEVLNIIDVGTSRLVEALPREDDHAETVILALTSAFLTQGLPQKITFDRDPPFVGSPSGSDLPSALIRYLTCLGIAADVCPPRRPDRNPSLLKKERTSVTC